MSDQKGKKGRGRPKGSTSGVTMGESHRTKIRNSKILSRLIGHVEGRVELSPTQVSAGLGLLKKVMPDLATKTVQGPDGGPIPVEVKEIRMKLVRADNK